LGVWICDLWIWCMDLGVDWGVSGVWIWVYGFGCMDFYEFGLRGEGRHPETHANQCAWLASFPEEGAPVLAPVLQLVRFCSEGRGFRVPRLGKTGTWKVVHWMPFFFFFLTLVTGPRGSVSRKLRDAIVRFWHLVSRYGYAINVRCAKHTMDMGKTKQLWVCRNIERARDRAFL